MEVNVNGKTVANGGYVPPQGSVYVPPTTLTLSTEPTNVKTTIKGLNPDDMFVVAPSLNNNIAEAGEVNLTGFKAYMQDYARLDKVIKEAKALQDEIKDIVINNLKLAGLDSAKTDYGTFTLVAETKSHRFSSAKLKEESPKIYELFMQPSVTKEHLKVTPKKAKK